MNTKQKGVTTVEFAIIGTLFFILLFGVIELGRLLFAWNTLTEATRRGARLAAVCPVNHDAIKRITVFKDEGSDGDSPILTGLDTDDVEVEYLSLDGSVIGDPEAEAAFVNVAYVRVGITTYSHDLLIPLFSQTLTPPAFWTTLPRESLGVAQGAPPAFDSACAFS